MKVVVYLRFESYTQRRKLVDDYGRFRNGFNGLVLVFYLNHELFSTKFQAIVIRYKEKLVLQSISIWLIEGNYFRLISKEVHFYSFSTNYILLSTCVKSCHVFKLTKLTSYTIFVNKINNPLSFLFVVQSG